MQTSISITQICPGLVLLLALVSCSPAAPLPATMTTSDYSSVANPCAFTAPAPTPTPGPPTPTPTPFPTSPFSPEDFPPQFGLIPQPLLELPAEADPLARALVSITLYPPAGHDQPASHATGLLVSADGLVLTVLDYTRPVDRIEVMLPGGATLEAVIERVDARTGATLLKPTMSEAEGINDSGVPFAEIAHGGPKVSPGEPVLLLSQLPGREETAVREGFAVPVTHQESQEMLFALLPIGSMGGNGALVVDREGRLLGMAGPGHWWGTALRWGVPYPGPPRLAVQAASLLSLLESDFAEADATLPVAVSYHGQNWGWEVDSLAAREHLASPAKRAMSDLGRSVVVENLGQDSRSVLGYGPSAVLELVYARPQELRSSNGELLGWARYVAFWWDREGEKPDVVLCGVDPETVGAAFLAGDLAGLKAAAASAPASGRSLVDFDPLPGYPEDYPLKWRVIPDKKTYHREEEAEFTVTIENLSDWPMNAYPIPSALEIVQVDGPGPVPWWQHQAGDGSLTVPAHQELKVVVPWTQVDHEGSLMPPGDYRVSVIYGSAMGTRVGNGGGQFSILEE